MKHGSDNHPVGERVCAVCRRVLDYLEDSGEWVHGEATRSLDGIEDHQPDPQPWGNFTTVRAICDFCGRENGRWVYPARDFSHLMGRSVGDWGACDDCHGDIQADRWSDVTERCVHVLESRGIPMGNVGQHAVHEIHARFREHRLGEPYLDTQVAV